MNILNSQKISNADENSELKTKHSHDSFNINKMNCSTWREIHLNRIINDKIATINKTLDIIKYISKGTEDIKTPPKKFGFIRKLLNKRKKKKFASNKLECTPNVKIKNKDDFFSIIDDYAHNLNSRSIDKIIQKQISKKHFEVVSLEPNFKKEGKSLKKKAEMEELDKENKENLLSIKSASNFDTNINTAYSNNTNLKTIPFPKRTTSSRDGSSMKNSSSNFFITTNYEIKKKKVLSSNTGFSKGHFISPRESMKTSPSAKDFTVKSKIHSSKKIDQIKLKHIDNLNKLLNDPQQENDLINYNINLKQSSIKIPQVSFSLRTYYSKTPSQTTKKNKQMIKIQDSFEGSERLLIENKEKKKLRIDCLSNSNSVKKIKNIKSYGHMSASRIINTISDSFNPNNCLTRPSLICKSAKISFDDYASGKLLINDIKILNDQIDKKGVFIQMEQNKTGRKFISTDSNNIFNSGDQIGTLNSNTAIKFKNILQNKFSIEFKKNEVFGIKKNEIKSKQKIGTSVDENVHYELKRAYNRTFYKKREICAKHKVSENKKM